MLRRLRQRWREKAQNVLCRRFVLEQLFSAWSRLDMRRRIVVGLATVAMFAAVLGLSRMAAQPQMALLYSGLDDAAAGEVLNTLEQRGVTYEVRGNAIYVARPERDGLRLTLASEGMPDNGGAGYELLDSLSGFGTTSQMFDAAYWRAKEGELARTILTNPQVRAARVHIANTSGQGFRQQVKPSASVSVTTSDGTLSQVHAKALRHLVASSVAGLAPEDVAVIDGAGGLVAAGDDVGGPAVSGHDLEERLRQNVARLLMARMGPGKSVVEVSVETVTERESILEHRFDPESRVAISTDTEERSSASKDSGGTSVSVASNLPEGDGAADRNSSSTDSQNRQRINYEVSETQREIHRSPGAIKRLSVAVLLDGARRVDETGQEIWEPLPEDELENLRELVASAVGFNTERGDVITLKSMPFDPILPAGTAAEPGLIDRLGLDIMSLAQLAVLALVGLVLGLFVVRPILTSSQSAAPAIAPDALTAPALLPNEAGAPTSAGEILPAEESTALPGAVALAPVAQIAAVEDPVERLRQLIQERRSETVEILRSWMEEDEETA